MENVSFFRAENGRRKLLINHFSFIQKMYINLQNTRSKITFKPFYRPSDAAAVYYMEASMLDGFGLKYLYRFFNVPFLELQV